MREKEKVRLLRERGENAQKRGWCRKRETQKKGNVYKMRSRYFTKGGSFFFTEKFSIEEQKKRAKQEGKNPKKAEKKIKKNSGKVGEERLSLEGIFLTLKFVVMPIESWFF